MMNVLLAEVALKWGFAEPNTPFEVMLWDCCTTGIVVIREDVILFAKPCRWDGKKAHFNYTGKNNCWFVLAAASTAGMNIWMDEAPYPMEWVAYHRRGKLKAHRWSRLRDRV